MPAWIEYYACAVCAVSGVLAAEGKRIDLFGAWLPSRRSTEHHSGARSSTRSGQVRSGRGTGGKGRYFLSEAGCMA